jgi:L-ribulose-5-phosphate 4-epimerase
VAQSRLLTFLLRTQQQLQHSSYYDTAVFENTGVFRTQRIVDAYRERPLIMVSLDDYSSDVRAEVKQVREVVATLHEQLLKWNLVVWTAGNVSQRLRSADLMVIKPSGVRYEYLTPASMVVTDLDGNLIDGSEAPSSDTASHAYIYRHMPEVYGVVHTHSTYATAWAATGKNIPCALTMMGDEFGGPVPVGPFRLIGSEAIGEGVVETLKQYPKSPAVLMQNHGPFTIGKDAESAVKAAAMTEEVAHTVWAAQQLGDVIEIDQKDIDSLNDRYQNVYGQH